MVEPGWLLSSVTAASAALVAIVGALLISRVISLSSDREALRRRAAELSAQVGSLAEELELVGREILRRDAVDFVHASAADIIDSRGSVSLDALMQRYDPRDRTSAELAPFVEEAKQAVSDAFRVGDAGQVLRTTADRYALLYAQLDQVISGSRGGGLDASQGTLQGTSNFTLKQLEVYRLLLRDQQSLRSIRRSTALDLATTRTAADALRQPRGVRGGLFVLLYFSAVGTVVPVAILAADPEHLAAWLRVLVVVLYVSGLAALCGYLYTEIKRLVS